jgi:alkylhydroperoxidase family enzyme
VSDPRIPPLPYADWPDEARQFLPRYLRRPELYESGGGDRPMPSALGHYALHLPIARSWLDFNDVLAKELSLTERDREILILRVAWRSRSAYEWYQHVRISQGAGLTTDHVRGAMEGPADPVWQPAERALVAAVDDLVERSVVTDATWKELSSHYDQTQLIEILYVAGAYLCLAYVFNSAGMQPDPQPEVDVPPMPEPER